jgi:hypothetical protein
MLKPTSNILERAKPWQAMFALSMYMVQSLWLDWLFFYYSKQPSKSQRLDLGGKVCGSNTLSYYDKANSDRKKLYNLCLSLNN